MARAALASGQELREEGSKQFSAFFKIADAWGLSIDEQLVLLGCPARSSLFKWRKEGGLPPRDTVERMSYIFGIYKALHILFDDANAADSWLRKPNNAESFGGSSALDVMLRGNISDLYRVRSYLDAQRGGWS